MFNNFIFENRTVYEMMWKNTVESGRPQMTVWCMYTLHAGYLRLQTHTQNLYRSKVHFVVYLSNTSTNAHIVFNNLKFTLKTLKTLLHFFDVGAF